MESGKWQMAKTQFGGMENAVWWDGKRSLMAENAVWWRKILRGWRNHAILGGKNRGFGAKSLDSMDMVGGRGVKGQSRRKKQAEKREKTERKAEKCSGFGNDLSWIAMENEESKKEMIKNMQNQWRKWREKQGLKSKFDSGKVMFGGKIIRMDFWKTMFDNEIHWREGQNNKIRLLEKDVWIWDSLKRNAKWEKLES